MVSWPQDVVKGHKNQYKINRSYIVIFILKSSEIKYRLPWLLIYILYCKKWYKQNIPQIYGAKITKINKNENFAVYNCHMYTQIVWNFRLVTDIIPYKAKNIKKEDMQFFCWNLERNLDSYFTLEYEHIRKIRGFSLKKFTDVTQFNWCSSMLKLTHAISEMQILYGRDFRVMQNCEYTAYTTKNVDRKKSLNA